MGVIKKIFFIYFLMLQFITDILQAHAKLRGQQMQNYRVIV